MDCSHRRALPTPVLVLALALAPACGGDEGNDDDTTVAASTSAATETTEAATDSSEALDSGGDSTTGFPAECEGLCAEGEICVVLGTCSPDPPLCSPAADVVCDFATGTCGVMDVCSGTLFEGALLCETCG